MKNINYSVKNIDYIEKLKYKHKSKLIDSRKTPEEIKLYIERKFKVKINDKLTKIKH